jgi:hypothetical protein
MSTILAPVPFAGEAVESIRREWDWSASLGVPAHITLLGPFLHPNEITSIVIERLEKLVSDCTAIAIELDRLALIGHTACLLPRDGRAVAELSAHLERAWPAVRGRDSQHVTLARGVETMSFERLANLVEPLLPLAGSINRVELLVRRDGANAVRESAFRLSETTP